MKIETLNYKRGALLVVAVFVFLGGCASKRLAIEHIGRADTALMETQKSDAQHYASLEIHQAQDKIELAKKAKDEGDYKESLEFSEEALLNTQLAEAKMMSAKAKANAEDSRRSSDALANETRRNRDARQKHKKD